MAVAPNRSPSFTFSIERQYERYASAEPVSGVPSEFVRAPGPALTGAGTRGRGTVRDALEGRRPPTQRTASVRPASTRRARGCGISSPPYHRRAQRGSDAASGAPVQGHPRRIAPMRGPAPCGGGAGQNLRRSPGVWGDRDDRREWRESRREQTSRADPRAPQAHTSRHGPVTRPAVRRTTAHAYGCA